MISPFELLRDTVSIWTVNLEQPADRCRMLAELLAQDERERAASFYFERDRRRYTVARGVLRLLLGRYTHQAPHDLTFDYNAQGKSALQGVSTLQFNVAHSHEYAVYALSCDAELGVDLEYLRPIDDLRSLARNTFSPRENAVFAGVPDVRKQEAFFNCWTRKEAYIKALGEGLSHALDSFDVTLTPGDESRLLWVANQPDEPSRWTMYSFNPAPNYVGAVATRHIVKEFLIRDFVFGTA